MSNQELRLHAVQIAIKHAADSSDVLALAQQIYEFIKGETK